MADTVIAPAADLPIGPMGHRALGWWGMLCVIATEGAVFVYLLFSYAYLALQPHAAWLPEGPPSLTLALPNTAVLVASSFVVAWGERRIRAGATRHAWLALLGTIGLGIVFVAVQLVEWHDKTFGIATSSYGSLYFTITGFHMAHVVAGLLMLAALALWTRLGLFDSRRNAPIAIGAIYWHFVDVVWLAVFFTFYLSPRLV